MCYKFNKLNRQGKRICLRFFIYVEYIQYKWSTDFLPPKAVQQADNSDIKS